MNMIIISLVSGLMKAIPSKPIIVSDKIINIAKDLNEGEPPAGNTLEMDEYPEVVPRVFPSKKIPSKVAVYRKIKQFAAVDINRVLGVVNWHLGEGFFSLAHYVFAPDFVLQYGCQPSHIRSNKVKARAYCQATKKFEKFHIDSFEACKQTFGGVFQTQGSSSEPPRQLRMDGVPRQLICFDFEDPIRYISQVQQAIKRRQKVLQIIKYEFYVDNFDLEGAPIPSRKMMQKIKELSLAYVKGDTAISESELALVINHYKRVMNQILFRHEVRVENLAVYIPTKYIKKQQEPSPVRRRIRIRKDNKTITLVGKSSRQKLEDLTTKSIFLNSNISQILLYLKQKLWEKPQAPLFLPISETIIEKYLIEQQQSIDYSYSAINEFIVDPLSSEIRTLLRHEPEGWFRLYQDNRATYLDSKLRRLFVLINNIIRDWVVEEVAEGLRKYLMFLRTNTPRQVQLHSICAAQVSREQSPIQGMHRVFRHVVSIEMILEKGRLKLSHDSKRVNNLLKKLILRGLQKFGRVPSPEPIVLKQLFGGYKNQEGIKIGLPIDEVSLQGNLDSSAKYPKIREYFLLLNKQVDEICGPLIQYERLITKTAQKIGLQELTEGKIKNCHSLQEIAIGLKNLNQLEKVVESEFQRDGSTIGFFYISYEFVKVQIMEMLNAEKDAGRKKMLAENKRLNTIYHQSVRQIQRKLEAKPTSVREMIEKQRLMRNLTEELDQPNRKELLQIRQLCAQIGCKIEPEELRVSIETDKIVNQLYRSQSLVDKEFQSMKKQELALIRIGMRDITDNLLLLDLTKESLSRNQNLEHYAQYAQTIRYLTGSLAQLENKAIEMREKESLLQVDTTTAQLLEKIDKFHKDLEPYDFLWNGIQRWKSLSTIWLNEPIGSYQLKQPEKILEELVTNLKKAAFCFLDRGQVSLHDTANRIREEIESFQPKLKLLRLLKKKGLSRKHLLEIGIELGTQIPNLSLSDAVRLGLFEKMSQIQAISNDAWNQFSLEQTIERLLKEIYELRFKVSAYKDRKKNDILIIVNYKSLIEGIDAVLNNIEAVQFNPMVKMFEEQIKQIYDKSLYISNSLNICSQFQKVLVELHPVFDSTDIVKQIPAENKKFAKLLRIWLELLSYIKSILSVHDSCGSQNIYERVKSMLTSIEEVKKQLISYLEQKRKGFSRFYLLSNSEMFQLFSATSDINSVNSLIPKLFDSMIMLEINKDDSKIGGVAAEKNCNLALETPINFKSVNIESWLSSLEKEIKISIKGKVSELIRENSTTQKWLRILVDPSSLPQAVYLLYEMSATEQMYQHLGNMSMFKQRQSKLLQELVGRKRRQMQQKLTDKADIMVCSLIILITSKLDIAQRFIRNGVESAEDFEWKKIVKSKFVNNSQKYDRAAVIQTLNYESQYGYEFLGCYSRLVVTNLTEKMQIVYFLAQMYSLGGAATGPAGTGKSETTKDIAKLAGKTCLIYNCSENFHEQTFLRLIKGLAISGLWMCLDEFNRLSYKILSMAAEQLSILLKYRSYKHRIEVNFMGEPIWLQPQFQICITYNPTYLGRRSIPKNLNQLFRTVALVSPDEFTICQALLFSYGYSRGETLAKLTINILKMCRQVWWKSRVYDFGLRALRSIVSLSSKLLISGKEDEAGSIIESLKILNSPKMGKQDNQLFLQIISRQFGATVLPLQIKSTALSTKLTVVSEILSIRDGILLCGEPLSGKESVVQEFKAHFVNWDVPIIFHDVLSVDELYGELDASTKLWRDGLFSALVKTNVGLGDARPNCMIVLNGSVYSEWVENLNSFLDATRKLSLSSGESVPIPPTLKLMITCTDLDKASPATITRFGLIKFEAMSNSELVKKYPKFPVKLLDLFAQIQPEIKNQTLALFHDRYILNWVLQWAPDHPMTYDSFLFYLAQIYEGLLTDPGKLKFDKVCRRYLSTPLSPFDLMLKLNGQPASLESEFSKFKTYQLSSEQITGSNQDSFEQIFIPTPRSYKLSNLVSQFYAKSRARATKRILMIVGDENIGKSRIIRKYLQSSGKDKNKNVFLFFTRKTSCRALYEELASNLTRKSSSKLGGNPGVAVSIWIEDLNMPTTNKFGLFQTAQLLRLMCSQNQWYNYASLGKETLEDLYFLSDAKNSHYFYKYPLNVDPRFYKHIVPIFCSPTTSSELQTIFKSILEKTLCKPGERPYSLNAVQGLTSILRKGIQFYWGMKDQQISAKNAISFTLNDLYRSLKGFLAWSLPEDLGLASQVFVYELSTHIISKISSRAVKEDASGFLLSHFAEFRKPESQPGRLPLFHNLENRNIATTKCEKVQDIAEFTNRFQCMCDDYRALTHEQRSIVVFPEMIEYLLKIYRTLSLDYSHVGIVGMSKCGKMTLVKLASYLISSDLYSIKDSNDNQIKNWQEAIKLASKACYKAKNTSLIIIKSKYLGFSWCTEDLNKLINTMDLPHLYSEADIEEMIYMMQVDLVRKNLPTTKDSMWTEFVAYLRQKMRVVLVLNPTFTTVKSCFAQYPSVVKLCTFFYLDRWPREALCLIARLEMPDLGYPLDIFPEVHQYCQKICQNSKLSILDSIWEGLYFDLIAFFVKIYAQNQEQLSTRKRQYEQSQKVVEQTEDQIEKTKNKIKKLQPTIIMIENETAKTVRNLQIQRKYAEEKNKELEVKNEEFEKIIKESRVLKQELQQKVNIVNLQIAKAWENVSLIKPNHISEVKALGNPSEFIKTVLTALVILTYQGPLAKEVREVNGHMMVQESYFETAKKYVLSKDAKAIGRMLTQFKRQYVTKEMFEKLQHKCLSYKRWGEKEAKSANKAIYFFFLWVEAVANQYRIYQETQPLRDELDKISTILQDKEVELVTIKKQLDYYQQKIEEFEAQHKIKKQSLQEYRIQIVKFERMLSRGHELLRQIEGEKQKWGSYIGEIKDKIEHNFSDSLVMAATMVYVSPHVLEIRKKIRQHIGKLCKKRSIPCLVTGLRSCEIPWYISKEQEQVFQSLQIHENQFLIDNIKVAEASTKVILLIDPEEQGIKLMKKLSWQSVQAPIDKISEYSPQLVKSIESAILYGRIVFIEVDAAEYNNSLRFVINPVLSTEGDLQLIKSGDKTIPIHENYRLYLYTTCYPYGNKRGQASYSMELLTNTQIINFKMTFEQLEQRILEVIINAQLPLLKAKIEEIYRVNIKDNLTLNSIEEKLLVMFSSELSAQQILESDQIINTVIHSNRLYKQISNRIAESKDQHQQIEKEKEPYRKRTHQACLLYENIQRLKLVKHLYAYSYHWFFDLFEGNVYDFTLTLYQQISKALNPDEKIVVAILIAEILHPNLPWKCLFNVEDQSIAKTIYTTHSEEQEQLKESKVDVLEVSSLKIGDINKQLPVSQSSWNTILNRVNQVKKFIPTLGQTFNEQPEIFLNLVIFTEDRIFEAIPDRYSHLDFFYRILLISCFRPECVISLVREWIKVNMGPGFAESSPSLSTLISNTKPYRPIITIVADSSIQNLQKIRQIYRQSHPKQEQNVPISHFHFSTMEECGQFETLIKSSLVQNAWVIVESISSMDVLTFIKQYFEELTIIGDKEFRLWVVMEERDGFVFGERFTQSCDKVRISSNKDIYKQMGASFMRYQDMLKTESDFFERNKKKMMISQLCILHHLLSEFSSRYFHLSRIYKASRGNKQVGNAILTMTEWDLKLLIEEMCYYKLEEYSKSILHTQLINKLTYGSQLSTFHLQQLLQANSRTIVNGIITERSVFWQTLWCEEKFPKDRDEYEHEIKAMIRKKGYMDNFGLDYKLVYKVKVNEYQVICKFYERTVFHQGRGISSALYDKLDLYNKELLRLNEGQDSQQLREQMLKLKQASTHDRQLKNIYHFCRIELAELEELVQRATLDINECLQALRQQQIPKDSQIESLLLSLYGNIAPWSISHRPVSLLVFRNDLESRYRMLNNYTSNYYYIHNAVNCAMLQNFMFYLHVLFEQWKLDRNADNFKLVFMPLQNTSPTHILDQLSLYGFELPPGQDPYPEEKLYSEYGEKLTLNTVFKKLPQQIISSLDSSRAKQKGIVGYAILQDLCLLNAEAEAEPKSNRLLLKVQIPLQDDEANLIKPIMNLAMSLRHTANLRGPNSNSSKNAGILNEKKVGGMMLIVDCAGEELGARRSRRAIEKALEDLEDQENKLVAIPCYEYALVDISEECEPVAMLYTLVGGGGQERVKEEVVRKNVHFSLRP